MGSWGMGPFDSDAACDFLDMLDEGAPERITSALQLVADAQAAEYIDVDDGAHAWVAAEIIAGAFGLAAPDAVNDRALETSGSLKPQESDRLLALAAVARLRTSGELHELVRADESMHREFERRTSGLEERLVRAAAGAKPFARAKRGDVLLLHGEPRVRVQVLNAREVVVFSAADDGNDVVEEELESRAHRVVTSVAQLARCSEHVGPAAISKNMKASARYATEAGTGPHGGYFENYAIATATGRNLELVGYENARAYESGEQYTLGALRELALRPERKKRVRSPAQREAAFRIACEPRWKERREQTRPGVFGDVDNVRGFLDWMQSTGGVDNMLRVFRLGGLPSAMDEWGARYSRVFAVIVAHWLGRWSLDALPHELAQKFPERPNDEGLAGAVEDARRIADSLLDFDSVLRMMWCEEAQGIEELEREVAELQRALSDAG